MTDFPLLTLNPANLEQVIVKTKTKSYFAIQQTCRYMREFIRASRKVTVHDDRKYTLKFDEDTGKLYFLIKMASSVANSIDSDHEELVYKRVDADALFGIRLTDRVYLSGIKTPENFNELCNTLKKCRITCKELILLGDEYSPNKEQCVVLCNLLFLEKIDIHSEGSDRYEALLQDKSLKAAHVYLDPESVFSGAIKLISKIPDVMCSVDDWTDKFQLIRKTLEMLFSEPFPNPDQFHLYSTWGREDLPTLNELDEALPDYSWATDEHPMHIGEHRYARVNCPQHDGHTCVIIIDKINVTISYRPLDEFDLL